MDPNGAGAAVVATDVLWSDPVTEPGMKTNDSRGVGLVFGPDVTQVNTPHFIQGLRVVPYILFKVPCFTRLCV
jgi:hypothetical protein